ncbi:phage tail protein [Escherichia coli]
MWLIKTNCWNADRGLQRGCEGLRHVPGDVIEICDDDYAGIAPAGACWR